jgi:hypothetical protein
VIPTIRWDGANKPVPVWNNGALIAIEGDHSQLFDKTGAEVPPVTVAIRGTSLVNLKAAARARAALWQFAAT